MQLAVTSKGKYYRKIFEMTQATFLSLLTLESDLNFRAIFCDSLGVKNFYSKDPFDWSINQFDFNITDITSISNPR